MGDTQTTLDRPADEPAATNPAPGPTGPHPGDDDPERSRHWYVDEIVVAGFALFGIVGGVLLPLRYPIPPITTSFLLATGLAALAYRYLGGIQEASVTVGALKLGGSLAALVGIALLINQSLAKQVPKPGELYEVTGHLTDDAGKPIQPLDEKDVAVDPALFRDLKNGGFIVKVPSYLDEVDGKPDMPRLFLSHDGYQQDPIDLNPGARNDVTIQRQGQRIDLGRVILHRPAQQYQPNVTPVPVSGGTPTPPPPQPNGGHS